MIQEEKMRAITVASLIVIFCLHGFSSSLCDGRDDEFRDVNPKIEIIRDSELVDEHISIRISDLVPGQTYTIHLETRDDMGRKWMSHADFVARHLNYELAGHTFFLPNLPPSLVTSEVKAQDMAHAERDAWTKMLQFLAKHTK